MPPDTSDQDARPRLRAADLLRPAFKHALWTTYDHIGLLVLANFLWIALSVPIVTAPAAAAALLHVADSLSRGEPSSLREFFAAFRAHLVPALKVGALDLLAAVLLWVNIDFYAHLGGLASIPGMVLAAIFIWAGAFYVLMHVHLYPLLVAGEHNLKQLLRKSALLVLDNVAFTVGIGVQALSLMVLCIVTGAGLVVISGSLIAVLLASGHRELVAKYHSWQPRPEPEMRTWRDLWRPWESGTPRT